MTFAFRRGAFGTADTPTATAGAVFTTNNVGDLLIASFGWVDAAGTTTITSVVDTAGNTWYVAAAKARNATQQYAIQTWYTYNCHASSGTNTVTATLSAAATFRRCAVMEWRSTNGAFASDPLDKTASATGAGTALSAGPVTPANNGQLIVGWGATGAGNIDVSGGAWTLREPTTPSSGVGQVTQVQSTAAAISFTATASVSDQWTMQGATFADVAPTVTTAAPAARLTATSVSSTGRARDLLAGGDDLTDEDLLPAMRPTWATAPAVVNNYWWGSSPIPVTIPYLWLRTPLSWLEDQPLNVAQVGGTFAGTAQSPGSIDEFGQATFTADLASATDADASTLARWVIGYYATAADQLPRVRFASLVLVLNARTPEEQRTILRVGEGTRITITGTPATWPAGATAQVVQGVRHAADGDPDTRTVEWTTSPLIGNAAGVSGPWFELGTSIWGGTDAQIF